MDTSEIQSYILKSIPMATHMGIELISCTDKAVKIQLPLKGNTNHIGTLFGGSQLSACAIGCWIFLRQKLIDAGCESEIVISKNESLFMKPVVKSSLIKCYLKDDGDWTGFIKKLKEDSRAKIILKAELENKACVFTGHYVAIKK